MACIAFLNLQNLSEPKPNLISYSSSFCVCCRKWQEMNESDMFAGFGEVLEH